MNLRSELEESKDHIFLLITSFFFFLLRLPSLFEPYWYGDEGIYHVIGMAMRQGRLLYSQIWDNKPPLLYAIYSLLSSDQFAIRLASLIVGILSIITFFYLMRTLFFQTNLQNTKFLKPVYLATVLFALLFGLPLLEGNIANAENFMILPILLAAFFLIRYTRSGKPITLLYSGVFLSIAFLIKIVAIFDLAAFVFFLLVIICKNQKPVSAVNAFKNIRLIFVGFVIPVAIVALFFLIKGNFIDFFNAVFKQNIGYVGWGNKLLIPQGLLIIKLLLLSGWCSMLFLRRKVFTKAELFVFTWVAFSMFNAFFSQRPYTHYMLVLLPSFSLLVGLIIKNYQEIEVARQKIKRVSIVLLGVIVLLLFKNFNFYYKKTVPYYLNFVAFITHKKEVGSYQSFFDRNTPNDYAMSQYINMHSKKNDTLFVWGNNAQVYKLTNKLPPGRYTVMYHMTANKNTIKETQKDIDRTKPTYMLITSINNTPPFRLSNYTHSFSVGNSILYERTF